jgi:hypothetical protein
MADDRIAEKLITDVQVTLIGQRRVDIRTADPKAEKRPGGSSSRNRAEEPVRNAV